MSRRSSAILVGAFVVGAVVLVLVGLTMFGAGRLLGAKVYCVAYFEESISGLEIGAPVECNGVRVGTVTDIRLVVNLETGAMRRPVVFRIEGSRISYAGEKRGKCREQVKRLVDQGLKAQLALQSLLTSQLQIQLLIRPEAPLRLVAPEDSKYLEIPTIPSAFADLTRRLSDLPVEELVAEAARALQGLADIINDEQTADTLANLNGTLMNLEVLLGEMRGHVGPAATLVQETLESVNETLRDLRELTEGLQGSLGPFVESLTQAADKAGNLLDAESPLGVEVTQVLDELERAARAMRDLADYLERHPEALLRGKR